MLLISQNLMNYEMKFPEDVVLRVNMAWVDSIEKFKETLDKYNLDFFIDFPSGRIKPPNNRYTMEQLVTIIQNYKKIKFLAISNVESPEEIDNYSKFFETRPQIVPKIETIKGVKNIAVRFSEYEDIALAKHFQNQLKWIWIDTATRLPITVKNSKIISILKKDGYKKNFN